MVAQRLSIEGKVRPFPGAVASLDHFRYREAEEVEARMVVEQPTISLYCLDHANRRAIFVETPPDVNLTHAPFYNIAQYDAALGLIAVSYDTVHRLAEDVALEPQRIILIYNVGRCGSTLVHNALNQIDGVCSIAEPDVFTQLIALRGMGGSNDAEVSDLARDCAKVMYGGARSGGAVVWSVKFRGVGIELGDLLYHHFPEAKVVFLYRNAVGWAKSAGRAFGIYDSRFQKALPRTQQFFALFNPLVRAYSTTHTTPMPPVELLGSLWAAVMDRCLQLQGQGVPMFCMRYEDLQTAPRQVLNAMFAFCNLTVNDPAKIDRIVVQDSQAGTRLSQATLQEATSAMPADDVVALPGLIQHYSAGLTPTLIVPHTFRLA
ncbi:MAG: sulfotransferase domain-containing protein [Herpetosiphonaceae bacterium]|nr:sulfotransferase domain-containing protein [Herpetosiphonaceae bacterium]